MGSLFSPQHFLPLAIILLLLFGGKGKISDLMGDFARGIRSFKKGMSEDEAPEAKVPPPPSPVRSLENGVPNAVDVSEKQKVG